MKKVNKFLVVLVALCMVLGASNITSYVNAATGDQEEPEVISTIVGNHETEVTADGRYYYTFTADQTGLYTFNLTGAELTTSGDYDVRGRVFISNDDYSVYISLISNYEHGELTDSTFLTAGESITIAVDAYYIDEEYETYNVATTVNWTVTYESVGTLENPMEIETMEGYGSYEADGSVTVSAATSFYYSYQAEITGELGFYYSELAEGCDIILTNTTQNTTAKLSESEKQVAVGYFGDLYDAAVIAVNEGDNVVINFVTTSTENVSVLWGAVLTALPGTEMNPISVAQGTQAVPVTVEIAADATLYFGIESEQSGFDLVITGENFTANIGGVEYTPVNGVLTGTVEFSYRFAYAFTITNTGDAAATYSIYLVAPEGAESNPEIVELEDGFAEVSHDFESYCYDYYFYKWVATEDGELTIAISNPEDAAEAYTYYITCGEEQFGYYYNANDEEPDTVVSSVTFDVVEGAEVILQVMAFNANELDYPETTVVSTFTFKNQEQLVIEEVVGEIEAATEEGEMKWDLTELEETDQIEVPVEFIEAAKENGVDLVFEFDGGTWVIDASTIEEAHNVNMGITIGGEEIPAVKIEMLDADETVQLSLTHNGEFGFTATLTIELGADNAGKEATLYYYDGSKLVEQGTFVIRADGTADFGFDHASEYVIAINEVDTTSSDTGEFNVMPFAGLFILAGASLFILRRRFR